MYTDDKGKKDSYSGVLSFSFFSAFSQPGTLFWGSVCLAGRWERKVRGSAGNEGKWIFVFVGVKWQAKTLLQGSSKVLCKKKRKGITLHCFSFFLYLLHWTQTIYFNFTAIKSMKENISKLLWELYPNQIPGRKITFFHFSFTSLHFHILPKKWTSSISRKKK